MRLYEYQGRELFARVGIPVTPGQLATTPEEAGRAARELGLPVVIKAQVLAGGRGKAGGVKRATTPEEARAHAERILNLKIKDEPVRAVLVTKAIEIQQEFYLSVTLDRSPRMPVVIFSPLGGVEIEEVAKEHPEAIHRFHVHPLEGLHDYQVRTLLTQAGIDKPLAPQMGALFHKLYEAFNRFQAQLAEINPLALSQDGGLVALDAKFIIDDDALPWLPELAEWRAQGLETEEERLAREAGLNYVALDGEIGIIGNGAGLVMATLDLVAARGGRPANFLDLGGGASAEQMRRALAIVLRNEQVKGIFINVFGGITRCDEVARGLVAALEELKPEVPLVVRLTGTNEAEGREILAAHGITPVAGMEEGADRIVALVGR